MSLSSSHPFDYDLATMNGIRFVDAIVENAMLSTYIVISISFSGILHHACLHKGKFWENLCASRVGSL